MVQSASELPDLRNAKTLYLDLETTSFQPAVAAYNTYKGHKICGICATADDRSDAWYVPIRHHDRGNTLHSANVDLDAGLRWLRDTVGTCRDWVNHGVKFDAHFAAEDGAMFRGRLVDTLTAAKLIDSDRLYKGGYRLKVLSSAWLGEVITDLQDEIKTWLEGVKLPHNKKAKDYGLVPPDIIGEYGCQDVFTTRKLHHYIQRQMPADVQGVWDTEILLTPVLFDMEREGMHVDLLELQKLEMKIRVELVMIEQELHETLSFPVNPSSPEDCYEVLVNQYGCPVLAWDKEKGKNPSFDKDALKRYLVHPNIIGNEERTGVVTRMLLHRKRNTLLNFFVTPYQEHEVNGVMHPDYNQAVRTGRLSCKRPNAQQLSKEAKMLVHPPKGEAFLSCDYSQIEFRLIVHYIKDLDAIKAYNEDPNTDFHLWVAEMCGIPRTPAKNVNFAIGYGAGKSKVTDMLSSDMDLMGDMMSKVEEQISRGHVHADRRSDAFKSLCTQRAEEVYHDYHDRLPGIKATSYRAARTVQAKGYVYNAYGRRRHLPKKASNIAFNALIQMCAADVMKERTVAVAPRYNSDVRDLGIRISSSVHDETLFVGPREATRDPRVVRVITDVLEKTSFEFRVPIRVSTGWSDESWAIAASDAGAGVREDAAQERVRPR